MQIGHHKEFQSFEMQLWNSFTVANLCYQLS